MADDPDLVPVPTGAIGVAAGSLSTIMGAPGITGVLLDDTEVAALRYPQMILTVDKMRRDAQVAANYYALTVPIRQYPWAIDPNGAEDEVVEKFADDVSLPILNNNDEQIDEETGRPIRKPPAPIGRTRNRFNHDDHLSHVFLSALYGHMYFEQQGYVDDDLNWRLQKLFPVMPRTIGQIEMARDGGLVSIRQNVLVRIGMMQPPPIPVTQLVAYIWNKEGANWYGSSILVPVYRHWLIKDRLLRVDAVKHERTGAGVPIFEAPQGASAVEIQRLDAMAQRYKVGEAAGGAVAAGTKVRLVGVEGATSDVLASIRYQDEQMAQAFHMEARTLGQSAYGSRALGETFAANAIPIQNHYAKWYGRIFNEHVAEDWVDWNFGPDYGCPRITHLDPSLETPGVPEDVKAAQQILSATQPAHDMTTTEVAAGHYLMHMSDEDKRSMAESRAWATRTLAAHGRSVSDRPFRV